MTVRWPSDNRCLPQEYLLGGGTLEDMLTKWAIGHKRHAIYPNLVQLKYSQLESPMGEAIVQQCRGLILDEAASWRIIARPFDKFFNEGEVHAPKINWRQATVTEKLDGSLIIMYYYDGEWRVATSGTPDASGDVEGCGWTFEQLFWMTWNVMGYTVPSALQRGYTFMFELMTPYNRVVVKHDSCRIKLIGVRGNVSGYELPTDYYTQWQPAMKYSLDSLEACQRTFEIMDPIEQEGYVVLDKEWRRIKVKHPGYVALHHLKDSFGPKRILEIIRNGETSELLTHFPEWKDAFDIVQAVYDGLVMELEGEWEELRKVEAGPEHQKTFAVAAILSRCSSVLFRLRKGSIKSVKEGLKDMHIDNLIALVGLRHLNLRPTLPTNEVTM